MVSKTVLRVIDGWGAGKVRVGRFGTKDPVLPRFCYHSVGIHNRSKWKEFVEKAKISPKLQRLKKKKCWYSLFFILHTQISKTSQPCLSMCELHI